METWVPGRKATALVVFTSFVLLGAVLPHVAEAADIAVSGKGWFTFRDGDEEAYVLNDMNRGDNPFSPFRVMVLTRAAIDDNTLLFLEIPIDPSANSSLFLTYLRPFVRLTNLSGKPWLNLQAGKLPTVFGTFGERTASSEAGLIGVPLLYFYHTAVRGNVVPGGNDFYFQPGIRGGGTENLVDDGNRSFGGAPLIYDACWDTGAEVFGARGSLQYTVAATHGTVSRPAMTADNYNDGYSFVGRVGYEAHSGPLFGMRVGVSGAVGPYLDSEVTDDPDFPADASPEDYLNTALGMDLAYATGPWRFFAEAGRVGYEVPNVTRTLTASSYYVEVIRSLGPSWAVAGRQEAVLFNEITSSAGETGTWDYDIWRWEGSLNYRFRPGARIKFAYQRSHFPDARELDSELYALQLQVWTR